MQRQLIFAAGLAFAVGGAAFAQDAPPSDPPVEASAPVEAPVAVDEPVIDHRYDTAPVPNPTISSFTIIPPPA